MHARISKLVGKKFTVNCFTNGTKLEALWDKGSQVPILLLSVLERCFSQVAVRDILNSLHAKCDNLNLVTANGTKIPYNG